MTRRDVRSQGYHDAFGAGEYAASDMAPDCTEDDACQAIGEWDDNRRQFSPFEFLAHDINDSHDPDGLWEAYDDGVSAGFRAGWKSVRPWPGTVAADRYTRRMHRLGADS